jgi:DNA-directed RNA polymerase subunit RPC12/RpoP
VAAGSTDGRLYVWDLRNPNQLLHELRHGLPICETPLKYLNPPTPYKRDERWMWDTGIRFCTWNHSRTGFVTGSSDGVVKIWDIFRSTEDAHRADLVRLDSAITAATYSQDYSRLIVGEVNKAITVLDVGHKGDDGVEEFVELHPPPPPAAAMDLDDEASNAQHAQAQTAQGARTAPPRRELGTRSVDEPTAANEALCQARIPANLRAFEPYVRPRRARALGLDLTSRPCLGCGASVPAALAGEGGGEGAWCQRCRFGCFRCGRFVRVPHPYDLVECRDCGLAWRVGAAGYDLVPRDGVDVDRDAPRVRQTAHDAWDGELADHYHALWGRG